MRTLPVILLSLLVAAATRNVSAQVISEEPPEVIRGLDISDRLGEQVPADIKLFNSLGETIEIGSYFSDRRPVVLLLVYYDCPMLCGLMLEKMNEVINGTDPTVGEDYKILVVSFDHTNTTQMAADHQNRYQRGYDRGLDELGRESFQFHTATAAEARRLSDAVGFQYRFVPETGEFAHGSIMYVLTPSGEVSSFLSGLDYEPKQLQLAIIDGRDSKISVSSIGEFFLHLCFSFDPNAGAYTLQAFRVMQVAGVLSIIGVAGLIGGLRLLEIFRKPSAGQPAHARTSSGNQPSVQTPVQGAV